MPRNHVSPVLVGRDAEMTALMAAFNSAAAAEPSVVLVGGEAGVGKTRLVEEAADRVRLARAGAGRRLRRAGRRGAAVHAARRRAALADARHAARGLDEFVGPARFELARLVPELDPQAALTATPAGESRTARLLELARGRWAARRARSRS